MIRCFLVCAFFVFLNLVEAATKSPIISGQLYTTLQRPSWSWTSGGSDPGTALPSGTFCYALNPPINIDDVSAGNSCPAWGTETTTLSYTSPSDLDINTTHIFQVKEKDSAGNWGVRGAFQTNVDHQPPPAPSVTVVATTTNDATPTWSWSVMDDPSKPFETTNLRVRYFVSSQNLSDPVDFSTSTEADSIAASNQVARGNYTPANALADGQWWFYIQTRDVAGWWSLTTRQSVVIDTIAPFPPSVSGIVATSSTTPIWTWTPGGGDGSGNYRYRVDIDNFNTGGFLTTQTSFQPSPAQALSEGEHTLYVQERDGVGNWSSSGSFKTLVDRTGPGAPSVSSSYSRTNDPTPVWNWVSNVNNPGNGSFRYTLDIADLQNSFYTSLKTYSPLNPISDGIHVLYVQELDAAGNWGVAGSFTVEIDTTPPQPPVFVVGSTLTTDNNPFWQWSSGGGGGAGVFRLKVDNSDFSQGFSEITATAYSSITALADGDHVLYVQERDDVHNWSTIASQTLRVDTVPPLPPVFPATANLLITNSKRPVWTWVSGGGSGNGTYQYAFDDATISAPLVPLTTSIVPGGDLSEGDHTLYVRERDAAGNWSQIASYTIRIDLTKPNPPGLSATSPTSNAFQPVVWTRTGGGNGRFRYRLDHSDLSSASETNLLSWTPENPYQDGDHYFYIQERDDAGNWSNSTSIWILVDTKVPLTAGQSPLLISSHPIQIHLSCSDGIGAGCQNTYYRINTSPWQVFVNPFLVSSDSDLSFYSIDMVGNRETTITTRVVVETIPPEVQAIPASGLYNSVQTVTLQCTDANGCMGVWYTTDGTEPNFSSSHTLVPISVMTSKTIKFFAVDNAGNQTSVQTADYVIDQIPPQTTISHSSGNLPYPQLVSLICQDNNPGGCVDIRYTLDGSTPDFFSQIYTSPIPVHNPVTLKWFSRDRAGNQEAVQTMVFTVPPFELIPKILYIETGQAANIRITGANQPSWLLTKDQGSLSRISDHEYRYQAPNDVATNSIIVTESLAGKIMTTMMQIHVFFPFAFYGSQGQMIKTTLVVRAGNHLDFAIRGGSGNISIDPKYISSSSRGYQVIDQQTGLLRFTAPSDGAFADLYPFRVEDPVSSWITSLDIRVPLEIDQNAINILEQKWQKLLTVRGAKPGQKFQMEHYPKILLGVDSSDSIFASVDSQKEATEDTPRANPAEFYGKSVNISTRTSFHLVLSSTDRNDLGVFTSSFIYILPTLAYSGLVQDESGNPLAGTNVKTLMTRDSEGNPYQTQTDSEGKFILWLPVRYAGDYRLLLEKSGFAPKEESGTYFMPTTYNENLYPVIRMSSGFGTISGQVLGLRQNEIARVYAWAIDTGSGWQAIDPLEITGDGTGVDSYTLILDSGLTYSRLTCVSDGYFSSEVLPHAYGFVDPPRFHFAGGNISGVNITMTRGSDVVFQVLPSVSPSLLMTVSAPDIDISSYTVSAFHPDGYALPSPSTSPSGTGLHASFTQDQRMNLFLEDLSGKKVASWSHQPTQILSTYPQGQVEVSLKSGFDHSFEIKAQASSKIVNRVRVQLPGDGIDERMLPLNLVSSFVEVHTRTPTYNFQATSASENKIFEIRLKMVDSSNKILEFEPENNILKSLLITLPFDVSKVAPGDLENEKVKIFYADTLDSFENGTKLYVPKEDIFDVNYITGEVVFKTNHLTFYSIGEISVEKPVTGPVTGSIGAGASGGGGGCFIATAACGSEQHWAVMILSRFRDEILLRNDYGKKFVSMYYRFSPPLAEQISKNVFFRIFALIPVTLLAVSVWLFFHPLWAFGLACLFLLMVRTGKN